MDRCGTGSAVSALTVISTSGGSQLSPGSLSPVYLQLSLGVGKGAVVAPGAAAMLGQVSTQAGLVSGHMASSSRVTLPRPPMT